MEVAALKLAKRISLVPLVFDELERMIIEGVLKPGDQINEKALSDRNGLSRAPIREACRRLEQAGLVEIIVNRGVFVRKISRRAAAELCEVKLVLARHACPLIAERITPSQLNKLRALVEKIEREAASGSLQRYYRLNEDFHHRLIDAADNQRLSAIYKSINKELNLFRWRAFQDAPALADSMAAHRTIIDALAARDAAAFARAMLAHLEAANQRVLQAELTED
jgi:DNA-binding GntR family transcriptional regulator